MGLGRLFIIKQCNFYHEVWFFSSFCIRTKNKVIVDFTIDVSLINCGLGWSRIASTAFLCSISSSKFKIYVSRGGSGMSGWYLCFVQSFLAKHSPKSEWMRLGRWLFFHRSAWSVFQAEQHYSQVKIPLSFKCKWGGLKSDDVSVSLLPSFTTLTAFRILPLLRLNAISFFPAVHRHHYLSSSCPWSQKFIKRVAHSPSSPAFCLE